jgi:hypothetical protein
MRDERKRIVMSTNNTENHTNAAFDRTAVETLTESLVELGTEWAVLGISFGTQALERSAKSLSLAAKTLSTISEALERKTAPSTEQHVEDSVEIVESPEEI